MKNISKIVSSFLIIFTLFSPLTSFAIAEPYDPGETLDPACVPGEINCYVTAGPISIINTSSLVSSGLTGSGVGSTGTESIFFGTDAGNTATNASVSNFLGFNAGRNSNLVSSSNFLGEQAGYNAENGSYSNFLGHNSGYNSIDSFNSNFIGNLAGFGADASFSNFIGDNAGRDATDTYNSNFIGKDSGRDSVTAPESNFLGTGAGSDTSNISFSNFIGSGTGYLSSDVEDSNLIGQSSGYNATGISQSNFIGRSSGSNADNSDRSNFIGFTAGGSADNSSDSNFIGQQTGFGATNANDSNFIGNSTGNEADNASFSNFIGSGSGISATNSSNSNFIGTFSGYQASNSAYSNLFGYNAGRTFTANNIGANNIIIGKNISLPNAAANSINIGGVLFGTGTYSSAAGDPSIAAVSTGKIGIGDVTPEYRLDVEDTTIDNNIFSVADSDGECLYNPEAGSMTVSCSSDERLKTNITDASSALDYFRNFKIKQYDIIASGDHMTGVIAQEVIETNPELVIVGSKGMYSVQLPNSWQVIKAIQELDIKIKGIANYEPVNFEAPLLSWLSDANNKIESIVSKVINTDKVQTKELCIDDVCITKEELIKLKAGNSNTQTVQTEVVEEEIEEEKEEQTQEESQPQVTTEPVVDENLISN